MAVEEPTLCIVSDKIFARDGITQSDNLAPDCALGDGGATTD